LIIRFPPRLLSVPLFHGFILTYQIAPLSQQQRHLLAGRPLPPGHIFFQSLKGLAKIIPVRVRRNQSPVDRGSFAQITLLSINFGHGSRIKGTLLGHLLLFPALFSGFVLEGKYHLIGTDHAQLPAGDTLHVGRICLQAVDIAVQLHIFLCQIGIELNDFMMLAVQAAQFQQAVISKNDNQQKS
jgi:hypothetical protein